MGELENNSKMFAPRSRAAHNRLRWLAAANQFQLDELGSLLDQSSQYPSICRVGEMFGETTMLWPLMLFDVQAPALYRTMLSPNPGNVVPLYDTVFVVNMMSASALFAPY